MLVTQHNLQCRLPVRGVEDTRALPVSCQAWFQWLNDAICNAGYLSEVLKIQGPFLVVVKSVFNIACNAGYLSEVLKIQGPFLVVIKSGFNIACNAGYLSEVLKIQGPFLVVVPLSTVPNWIKEFRKWTPQLNALVYVGDSKSREVIRTYEFYNHRGAARPYRFEVPC